MGSFSIKEDNFKNENDNRYSSRNSQHWTQKLNKPVVYIIASVAFIVIVNVVLFFCFFNKSESLIEIPDNFGVKEYYESSTMKDQNIYKLLSKNPSETHEPVVIESTHNEEKIHEPYLPPQIKTPPPVQEKQEQDEDRISFNNIRSLDVETKSGEVGDLRVSQKILDIDNNSANSSKVYRLNVGVFLTHNLAEEYVRKLKETHQILANASYYVLPSQFKNKILYKVLIGSFNSEADAEAVSEKLESMEINNTIEEY